MGVGGGDLDGEEMLQDVGEAPVLGLGLVEDPRQRVGGVGEFQLGQVATQLLVDARRRRGGRGGLNGRRSLLSTCGVVE